jgi:ribosomal protein S18 acetylase RimI-like enzyme
MEAEASWELRAATAADIEPVLALWRDAGVPTGATDSEPGLRRLLEDAPGSLLLAQAPDCTVAGTLIVAWDGWRGSFYRLAVRPEWRRRGVGTALVRAGERRLADLGAVRLTALLTREGPAARGLWASMGYTPQQGVSRFVKE